jgi:hypothetical protein
MQLPSIYMEVSTSALSIYTIYYRNCMFNTWWLVGYTVRCTLNYLCQRTELAGSDADGDTNEDDQIENESLLNVMFSEDQELNPGQSILLTHNSDISIWCFYFVCDEVQYMIICCQMQNMMNSEYECTENGLHI